MCVLCVRRGKVHRDSKTRARRRYIPVGDHRSRMQNPSPRCGHDKFINPPFLDGLYRFIPPIYGVNFGDKCSPSAALPGLASPFLPQDFRVDTSAWRLHLKAQHGAI
jgi:hypothetical protein